MYKEFNVGHDTRSVRVNLKLRIFKPASIEHRHIIDIIRLCIELLNVRCICIYINACIIVLTQSVNKIIVYGVSKLRHQRNIF